jgi:hypothetical protein
MKAIVKANMDLKIKIEIQNRVSPGPAHSFYPGNFNEKIPVPGKYNGKCSSEILSMK